MSNNQEKPSFESSGEPEKPSFGDLPDDILEIEDSPKSRLRLPRKALFLLGGSTLLVILGFILIQVLGGRESSPPPPQKPEAIVGDKEIDTTMTRFYKLLAEPSDEFCSLFAEGVFDKDDPLVACRAWRKEAFPSLPVISGGANTELQETEALTLYTLQYESSSPSGSPSSLEAAPPENAPSPQESAPSSQEPSPQEPVPPSQKPVPLPQEKTPGESASTQISPRGETDQSTIAPPQNDPNSSRSPDDPSPTSPGAPVSPADPATTTPPTSPDAPEEITLQGGAVLIFENNSWKIATLSGLPGTEEGEGELRDNLAEEYELLRQGSLYNLPEEPTPPPDAEEKVLPEKKSPPKKQLPTKTASGLSCEAKKRFDLSADVRSGDFRLFEQQGAVSGGDILQASHSSGRRQSCLFVKFRGNYASVDGLSLSLTHHSWQASSGATLVFVFSGRRPAANLQTRRGQRTVPVQFRASPDGKSLRLRFRTPKQWISGPREFWFLRSEWSDPLGGGGQVFDEGRQAGQTAPPGATNLLGGWPF